MGIQRLNKTQHIHSVCPLFGHASSECYVSDGRTFSRPFNSRKEAAAYIEGHNDAVDALEGPQTVRASSAPCTNLFCNTETCKGTCA